MSTTTKPSVRGRSGPRLRRAIGLWLATATALAACGGVSERAASSSPSPPALEDDGTRSAGDAIPQRLDLDDPPPMDLDLVAGNSLTAWALRTTQEELPRAAAGIEQLTGHRADDLQVFLYGDRDELLGAYVEEVCPDRTRADGAWGRASTHGRAGDGYIFLLLTDDHRAESDREDLVELLTHEYIHTIQHDDAPAGPMVGEDGWGGPMWLSEGVASYLTYRYRAYWRQRDCQSGCFRDVFTGGEAHLRELAARIDVPLTELHTPTDYEAHLASCDLPLAPLTSLAAHDLAQRSSLAALLDYYRVARRRPWQDAFEQTFGVAVGEFYEQFAAARAAP